MKKIIQLLLALCFGLSLAQAPANYYSSAENLSGAALKTELSKIISNGHRDRGYNGLWTAFKTTDVDKFYENDGTVLDIYSENPTGADPYNFIMVTDQCGNYKVEGDCYNREHIVPQSLFSEKFPMKSDVHHIRATDGKVNGYRDNYPFGVVKNASITTKNGSKLGSSASPGYGGTVFEPIDAFKGDVARMILYFVTRYESQLSTFKTENILGGSAYPGLQEWELRQLLKWAQQDPVSPEEISRNNAAYAYQGNRNPYIDRPDFVEKVWGQYLSASETETQKNFRIFPNPVKDGFMNYSGAEPKTEIKIINAEGRMVRYFTTTKSEGSINLNLPKGTYIVKAGKATTKLVVQ
ncbi:Por secretion system C-terminal sorting domain-containing protein [Cruoricaptor ignavus]|uniref:Por secretion system C-terminal sorting domain-containing protein n=1 Tax=Cruoricaptor ignavus TaxID=1118202 RepID=A0A1M6DBJ9_9FLAO|nr:endonuclease [Cruoricaptor ignavus]SHI70408.1 Por secretion system C-terminal sorting domain-containing protein [Cruoricaptor ignavus]